MFCFSLSLRILKQCFAVWVIYTKQQWTSTVWLKMHLMLLTRGKSLWLVTVLKKWLRLIIISQFSDNYCILALIWGNVHIYTSHTLFLPNPIYLGTHGLIMNYTSRIIIFELYWNSQLKIFILTTGSWIW